MDKIKIGRKKDEIKNDTALLLKEIESLKKQVEEYKNKYLRALADYQNYEKRMINERNGLIRRGEKELILKLLPIIDDLDQAEIFVKDHGLKQIKSKFQQLLKNEQVEEIAVLGKPFDPAVAEAVDVVSGDHDNLVVEVVRKGYRMGDKVLRVAQVKVSKKA